MLITGGTGALGGLLARHMVVAHGVRVCFGEPAGDWTRRVRRSLRAELEGLGARVRVAACDVSDREQAAER